MAKVICIGSTSKDIFFPTAEGLIIDTPEDVVSQKKIAFELGAKYQVKQRFETLGGCAANVAKGLADLEEEVACYTVVGDDELGKWILKTLKDGRIGTECVEIATACKSDLSLILVDEKTGQRTIFSDRDANDKLWVQAEKLQQAHWLFVSSLNGEWQQHLRQILAIAKEKKISIAFNPGQKNIKTGVHEVAYAIAQSELLFLNKDEAIEIVSNLDEVAVRELLENEEYLMRVLYRLGAKNVIITDGERGAWSFDGKTLSHAEALLQKAVDTTGAGDAFTSGFFAAYLKKCDLPTALKWGIANSSASVLEFGGQAGLLSPEKIKAVIEKISVQKTN